MKSILGVIVGAIIVLFVIAGVVRYQENKRLSVGDSELYVGITDATADINNINEINLEIKGIALHRQREGWVNVSKNDKTYGLLALKTSKKIELYAKEKIQSGSYDGIRVMIGDVNVKTKTDGDVKATTPSKQITISAPLIAQAGKTSFLKIDVKADQSIHMTVDNKYVFAPVIDAETRSNATVALNNDDYLDVSDGKVDFKGNFGVDLEGLARKNFRLDTKGGLEVDNSIVGSTKFRLGGKTYEEKKDPEEDNEDKGLLDSKVNTDIEIDDSMLKVN